MKHSQTPYQAASSIQQKYHYLLPKLKSYSYNEVLTLANLSHKQSLQSCMPSTHDNDTLNRKKTLSSNHNHTNEKSIQNLSNIRHFKYQYINKSPNYFKKKNRTLHEDKLDLNSYNQPLEYYLEEKMKEFDKKALMDIVNSRIQSIGSNNTFKNTNSENKNLNSSHKKFLTIDSLPYEGIKYMNQQKQLNQHQLQQLTLNHQPQNDTIEKLKSYINSRKFVQNRLKFQNTKSNESKSGEIKLFSKYSNKQSSQSQSQSSPNMPFQVIIQKGYTGTKNVPQQSGGSMLYQSNLRSSINEQNLKSIEIKSKKYKSSKLNHASSQPKKVQFYDTKYSNFTPNKLFNVQKKIIKKYPSLKLNNAYH